MNRADDSTNAPEQPIFWDAVWTLDDEWTPQPVVLSVIRPRSGDRDANPEFLALL